MKEGRSGRRVDVEKVEPPLLRFVGVSKLREARETIHFRADDIRVVRLFEFVL
jgi:hypothetical protein